MAITIEKRRTLAIGETVENVLEGLFGRVLTQPSKVTIGYTSSVDLVDVTAIIGNEILIDTGEAPDTAASVRTPDDIKLQDFFAAGAEIILKAVNGNAAAAVFRFLVVIEPV